MPSTAQLAPARPRTGLRARLLDTLILWHLLSLDAPTVAALWTWFIARTVHAPVPPTSILAMFLAVWILYAADRLLDARLLETHSSLPIPGLEARHLFHFHHRRLFRLGIILASVALAPLLLTIPAEAIRLYLIAGALLFAWFVLIHIAPALQHLPLQRLPKELAVGAFFASAIFIPTVARLPSVRPTLLAPAILFAVLCSLNCLFIYAWEHPGPTSRGKEIHETCHPTTRIALAHLQSIALTLILAALLTALPDRTASAPCLAIALAAALLLVLHACALHRRQPFPRTALRAAADLALLTPILILPFLR